MLVEMRSPVFKELGQERPVIKFKSGLNVILGKEDGENSIGKSSAMLAIDFAFGGTSYLNSDGIKHVGDHTLYFSFYFHKGQRWFARRTDEAEKVFICTPDYELTGEVWTKAQFTNWLKDGYGIYFEGLSFRQTISSFFRIYGKENLDERHPLKGLPGQNMQSSIDILVKLFNCYKDIAELNQKLEKQKKMLSVFREARKYQFIPDMVGGKKQYEENLIQIENLQMELDTLRENQVAVYNETDLQKGEKYSVLQNNLLIAETQIQNCERRLKLVDMGLDYGLYPTDADLEALQEFFPQVNMRKIYDVERYHKKLAAILRNQFEDEKQNILSEIDRLEGKINEIKLQIRKLGYMGSFSKEFLDKYSEVKGKIDAIKAQNDAFLTMEDMRYTVRLIDKELKNAMNQILFYIETQLNNTMQELNDSLFDDARKAPKLRLRQYNSYTFETPDDNGTGSNYKGLVIYDLAVLVCTELPAIAHDSLILKNISDTAINGIMRIYEKSNRSNKQIFIAFDKQGAYGEATRRILSENTVLKLSNNGCELYGESWNKEGAR